MEINRALGRDKYIELFGLSSVASPGRTVYQNCYEELPFITQPGFIKCLNAYIDDNKIDFLLPAHDNACLYLAKNRDQINCKVLISATDTCLICRSKTETYNFFSGHSFIPEVFKLEKISSVDLPLFAKPNIGQGSEGVAVLKTMSDLQRIIDTGVDYTITELLTGNEYTVDCFTDNEGNLLVASMRERTRAKSGIAVESKLIKTPQVVLDIATVINLCLKFTGVWFFQVKKNANGEYRLLEIAPRVAGTMGLSRIQGFNFVLNTINLALGKKIKVITNKINDACVSRALTSRYILDYQFDTVYVDFDDTLIFKDKVNSELLGLLYHFKNTGKKIILLSRHETSLEEALREYAIAPELFFKVHRLTQIERKSDYITSNKAIFIDDSFRERYDIHTNCAIPVFDVDAIEALW
ncbi:MAG: ATP-grasp domain-containing protein [Coriobacteriales bacterium]|nr:ATP-grasp domain-containing protein [Coriobacteriales bacterium]